MTHYKELIQKLFRVNLFGGMKLGLQNCLRLQQLLHYPDRSYHSIHVAGTNGKGSVATKIARGLQHAGLKVGLYTSPHLSCFRERIRINGEMISEQEVEVILPSLFHLTSQEKIPATFFELVTFLALQYFANKKVDVAVLEAGLGGRLDATNIVYPLLSVITSISLDHTEILGPTIEAIAKEKAGIIKTRIPVVIGPRVPLSIIEEVASSLQSSCIQMTQTVSNFEQENRLLAKMALQQLSCHFPLSPESILDGLEGGQPCRFERFSTPCPVILDVAHNPDGLSSLFQVIKQQFPSSPLRVLFGISKNKDILKCLAILKSYGKEFHLVEATNGRGVPIQHLRQSLSCLGIDASKLHIHETIYASMRSAIQKSNEQGEVLVVCGSFFIMSPIREALGLQEPRDEVDMNEK